MISRCPSCGAQVPEDVRVCGACGWDFIARKKGPPPAAATKPPAADKKPPIPSKPAEPPPASGFSLPPARTLAEPPPGVEKPKDKPKAAPPPAPGDENPFTLPAARKPLEPLAPLGGLPQARDAGTLEPTAALPPRGEPPKKESLDIPAREGAESPSNPKEEKAGGLAEADAPLPAAPPPRPAESGPESASEEEEPPEPVLALPTSPTDDPARRAGKPAKPDTGASSPVGRKARPSPVYIAGAAGAALGLVSVIAGFLLLKPEAPATAPRSSSPFGQRPAGEEALRLPAGSSAGESPAPQVAPPQEETVLVPLIPPPPPGQEAKPLAPPPPAAPSPEPSSSKPEPPSPVTGDSKPLPAPPAAPAPAPKPVASPPKPAPAPVPASKPAPSPAPKPARPTADFSSAPKIVVGATKPAPAPVPDDADPTPAAAPEKPARKPAAPRGPRWLFEGVAYDLLTTQGVFGAKLVFINTEEETVGEAETNKEGKYKVSLPAGTPAGYSVRVVHDDYAAKPIEEMDSTSSLRNADLDQRKFLLSSGARSIPWVGSTTAATKRDMALVPRSGAE